MAKLFNLEIITPQVLFLQEEVEWGNKSIFSKIFGKRNYNI